MNLQGHSFGQVFVGEGANAHLGDQYISIYQNHAPPEDNGWLHFLRSLRFPEMNARYNEITDTNDNSFEWVLNPDSQTSEEESKLASWLASGDGAFLVQGKPGSGKSTFMKYVFDHSQTQSLLQQWSGGNTVILLFHSFWAMGQKIQNSWKGFLASMLSQAVMKSPQLLSLCSPASWKHSLADWSERELEANLKNVLCSSTVYKCLIIDALDEFDPHGDERRLLNFILQANDRNSQCKMCLSTRPHKHILEFFQLSPWLRLQDLTQRDILSYVSITFEERLRYKQANAKQISDIITAICDKADGVFLWVYYVVQHVCRNIDLENDLTDVARSIDSLPPAMGELYQKMWLQQNQPKLHTEESVKIFCLGQHLPMTLFQFAVALDESIIQQYLTSLQPIGNTLFTSLCRRAKQRLLVRTAGLMECITTPFSYDLDEVDLLPRPPFAVRGYEQRAVRVKYLHGTVKNFLIEDDYGRTICSSSNLQLKQYCDMLWIQSYLVCMIENVHPLTITSLHSLLLSKTWCGSFQSHLVDTVDSVCGYLIRERLGISETKPGSWCFDFLNSQMEIDFSQDFEGIMVATSSDCTEYMLNTRGKDWSAYYKGYLALCSTLYNMGMGWGRDDKDEVMLRNLTILKQRGADLASIHPYRSAIGSLAARSAATRLLISICCTLLNVKAEPPRLSNISALLDIIHDVNVEADNVTFVWNSDYGHWSASPSVGLNAFITFQATHIRVALLKTMAEHKQFLLLTRDKDEFAVHIITRIRRTFFDILINLHCEIGIAWNEGRNMILHDYRHIITGSRRFLDSILNKREMEEDLATYISTPPNFSDIDYSVRFDDVLHYLEPHAPHEEIKRSEWKHKGVLRRYYATCGEPVEVN